MELAVTLLIVALATALVLRKTWQIFHGGKPGCASGCGSCPSNVGRAVDKPLVTLTLPRR